MPYRRLPNTMSAVIRTLKAARDQWKLTPVPADRAITDAHWAQLDDAPASNSFLNRLLKEASDVDLAQAAQAPLTTALSQSGARLTLLVSHFHQVLDLGITRGTFAAGARGYYGRDVGATSIPDLSTQDLVAEAAEKIVTGEAARATAEGQAHLPMSLPSAAEVAALRTQYLAVRGTQHQAVEKTDREREELAALRAAISEQEKCEPMAWGLQMPNEKQPRQIWLVKDTAFKNAMMRWPEAYEGAYQIELYTHPAPVPAGWQLVPVEPTEKQWVEGKIMLEVMVDCGTSIDLGLIYKVMLQAAPKPGEMK